MTKTKSTKHALLSSVIALFLCFTMLLGTTFAWFTDSVTSANNIIKSGTLNVEMYYADGSKTVPADNSTDWKNAQGVAIYTANQLWEPGYTDAKHIKISNEGTLALKYQLAIIPTGTVSELAEVIDVYLYEIANTDANATQVATRDEVDPAMYVGTLADVISKGIVQGTLAADTDYTTTIVLKMRENAGNEYQDKSIGDNFTIQLLATQLNSEKDSFDTDYDKDAWMDGMQVYTASDLQAALSNGKDVVLMNDIEVTNTVKVPARPVTARSVDDIVIDLNGKTLTGKGVTPLQVIGCAVTVTGGKLVVNGVNDGNASAIDVGAGATLTFKDATIESSANGIYDLGGNNTIVIESGSISATGDDTVAVATDSTLIINGGTFTGTWGLYAWDNANVTVNGGTFNGLIQGEPNAKIAVKGGIFTDEYVANYAASGYHALPTDGKYYIVPENIDAVVSTNEELQAAVNDCKEEIILTEGEFTVDLYNIVARDSLTITGQGAATKLNFKNLQVRLSQFKSLTINNLEMGRMLNKGWGQIVFGSSTEAGGVYTISECIFNGVGTQGIYINQTVDATFNVENCTFNGDFGREGAITIQDNPVKFTVNVTDCEFNNIPETSHEIYTARNNTTGDGEWALNVDGKRTAVHSGSLKNAAADGAEVVYFMDGEYGVIDVCVGRKLTILPHDGATVKFAGINGQRNNNASDITIMGITIDNSLATEGWYTGTAQKIKPCVGVWGGDYTFVDCTFFVTGESGAETGVMSWWTTNHGTMTFKGCTFNGGNGSARGMQIYGNYDLNVEDCTFTTAKDYSIKYVGGEGCKATLTGNKVYNTVNFVQAGSKPYAGTNYTIEFKNNILADGINSIYVDNDENQTIIIDGKKYVYNAASLDKAVAAGETNLWLLPGNYTLPTTTGDITISGSRDTVITVNSPRADKITLKGVTVVGSGLYTGIQHSDTVVFEDCAFNGLMLLYGNTVEFKGCTFDSNGEEHSIWTYGAKNVSFTGCDFTYGDRSVNCYSESGKAHVANVSFTDCTFTKVDGKATTGAIETNSSNITALNLTINNCSVNEGKLWFVADPWDSLKGANTSVTVGGKVTVATAEQLRALAATATGKVEIVFADDITLGNDTTQKNMGAYFLNATEVIINGNYKVLTLKGKMEGINCAPELYAGIIAPNAKVSVKDLTIVNEKLDREGNNYCADRKSVYTMVRGTEVLFENVTFDGGVQVVNNTKFANCSFKENILVSNDGVYANNGMFCVFVDFEYSADGKCEVTFENCKFDASGYGCVKLAGDDGAKITVNVKDCSFKNTCPSNAWSKTTPKYDVKMTGANITVNDLGGNTWAKGYGKG